MNKSQCIRIRLRAYDVKVIEKASKDIIQTLLRTGAKVAGPVPLPTTRKTFTVNKAPGMHKKSREQFEMRTHKRLIDVTEFSDKTIAALSVLTVPTGCDIDLRQL